MTQQGNEEEAEDIRSGQQRVRHTGKSSMPRAFGSGDGGWGIGEVK